MPTSHITTHVLNTTTGLPAADVAVVLETLDPDNEHGWTQLATATTDQDGRVKELGPAEVPPGSYRLRFDTGAYFAAQSTDTFFPEVTLTFAVTSSQQHYHVPLLLSPFAYSTYRGS